MNEGYLNHYRELLAKLKGKTETELQI